MEANVKGSSNHFSWKWQRAHDDIQRTWRTLIDRFNSVHRSQVLPSTFDPERLTQDLVTSSIYPYGPRFSSRQDEVEGRLCKELKDVQFRLEQGLEKCDQFWVDEWLLRCRHSRSKWLSIPSYNFGGALMDVYSHELKTRDDVIYVSFFTGCDDDWVADTIHNMPNLTSVYSHSKRLGDIERGAPLFIDTGDVAIEAFLEHNKSRFAETHRTFIYINSNRPDSRFGSVMTGHNPTQLGLHPSTTIAISFFGPTSGSLTLRLRHHASTPNTTLIIGDMTGSPAFQLPVPSMLSVDHVTIHPNSALGRINFKRGTRNNLIIQVSGPPFQLYWLQDIQLLDEGGCPYNPSSSGAPNIPQASSSRSDPHQHRDIQVLYEAAPTASPGFSEAHDDLSVPSTSK
jgi:hypothetical protein